ncbi:10507_t:CDS:2 [Acaulospora colombiana]|uniref:10507_t:CDS:1 n=1 Tax=Acaulospora colombiana TaxID=27376 RepID=A0ACA9P1K2_9GLOM|nr:10507_t:CDS:2 [Acaulospora colombiana]
MKPSYPHAANIAFAEYANGGSAATPLVLQKPFSRGSVLINTTDPFADPLVNFGAYNNPVDLEIMLDIFKTWRKLLTLPSWKVLNPIEYDPGVNVTTDDDLKEYLRQSSTPTIAHPCCTAAMMPKRFGGVVDSNLKVYGVNGLSVVDASIMPIIPSTHLQSTVYAVAEKASGDSNQSITIYRSEQACIDSDFNENAQDDHLYNHLELDQSRYSLIQ